MELEDNPVIDKGRLDVWKENAQPINLHNYFMLQERRPHSRETQNRTTQVIRAVQKQPADYMRNR